MGLGLGLGAGLGSGVRVRVRLLPVLPCLDWALDCPERDPLNFSNAKRPAKARGGPRVGLGLGFRLGLVLG